MKKARNGLVDIAKFAAAIGIMLGHWYVVWPREIDGLKITGTLFRAGDARLNALVALFFTVSGYYAAKSFKSLCADESACGIFLRKRIKRLFPPLVLSVLIATAAQLLYRIVIGRSWLERSADLTSFLLTATGMNSWVAGESGSINSPLWFVSILFLCLLLYTAVAGSRMSRNAKISWFCAIAVLGLACMKMDLVFPLLAIKPARGLMSFFLGVLFGLFFRQEEKRGFPVLWLLILAAAAAVSFIGTGIGSDLVRNYVLVYSLIIAPALIRIGESDAVQFLAGKVSRDLGELSFYIYLMHMPVYVITGAIFGSRINYASYGTFAVVLIIVLLISVILYRVSPKLEQAFSRFIHNLGF